MGIRVLCEMPNDQLADFGLIVKNSRTLGFPFRRLVAECKAFRTGGVVLSSVKLRSSSGLGVRFPSFPNEVRVFGCLARPQREVRSTHNLERHPSKLCLTTKNSIVRHPPTLPFSPQTVSSLSPPPSAVLQFNSD